MLSNLPIGVYLPGTSFVHNLRARTKLLLLIWLAGVFFMANHKNFDVSIYVLAFVVLAVAIVNARMPLGYLWRRMRLLLLLLLIGIPVALAWTPGDTWQTIGPLAFNLDTPWWGVVPVSIGPVVITYDGIWYSISFTAIFLLLYLGSMLLTLTTSPVALAEAIVLLLRPLRRVGLPADEFGLMVLISLRFIPVLMQETETLIKAQTSRGAEFTSGSIAARVQGISTLLVPLAQAALRRAEDLSVALEARGYGVTGEATMLHEGRLRFWDWAVLLIIPLATLAAYFFL